MVRIGVDFDDAALKTFESNHGSANDNLETNDDIRILSDDELENIKSGPIYDIDSITGEAVNEIYYGKD